MDVVRSGKTTAGAVQAHEQQQLQHGDQLAEARTHIVDVPPPELHTDVHTAPSAQLSAPAQSSKGGGAAAAYQGPWMLGSSAASTGVEANSAEASSKGADVNSVGAAAGSAGAGGSNTDAAAGNTGSWGGGQPEEAASVVAQLQWRVFWAKLWVTAFAYGFDACAALVFTLSVLGTVQLAVLQGLAVAGVTLGSICYFLGLDFMPPTMAAFAKAAVSRERGGKSCQGSGSSSVLQHCSCRAIQKHLLTKLSFGEDQDSNKIKSFLMKILPFCYVALYVMTLSLDAILGHASALDSYANARVVIDAFTLYACIVPLVLHGASALVAVGAVKLQLRKPDRPPAHDSRGISRFSGLGDLPAVWAWQCWVDLAPKAARVVGCSPSTVEPVDSSGKDLAAKPVQAQGVTVISPAEVQLSIIASVDRFFNGSWLMFQVYFLTEWIRIVLLIAAACIAVSWRTSAAAAGSTAKGQTAPDYMRAAVAVLSLAVTYIKSVRDRWRLLARGMQQASFAGAVVKQLEQQMPAQHRSAAPKLKYMNRFGSFVARWWRIKAALQGMSDDEIASPEMQQVLLVVQEMVRRANKAVLSENLKACYL